MTFHDAYNGGNCSTCEWILAEGTIVNGSSGAFLEYLQKRFHTPEKSRPLTVYFNSNGGDVIEALKIGRLIREWGLDTSIGKTTGEISNDIVRSDNPTAGVCASSCAYAILGGNKRYLSNTGKLGVHQHYSPKSVEKPLELTATAVDRSMDQIFTAIILDYVVSMGIDPEYAVLAQSTPPVEVHWLSEDEIKKFGVDNTVDQYSDPKIIPFGARGAALEVEHVKGVFANLATPTKFRLYCRGKSATPYLAAIITDRFDYESAMQGAVANNIDFKVTNDLGLDVTVHPTLAGLKSVMNANSVHTLATAWALEGLSVGDLAEASTITAVDGEGKFVPHYAYDLQQMLTVSFTNAGPLIQLALRNCIQ
ncbi:hypothetical protein [Mesorhizobium sp. B2-3-4]|uniref:COG3904 family protein n=1 Tax=Mesorhizobium sp. B2-3-4 TaxID=2589959 RepID=UPI00112BBB78|nr:hypothetical protein [Mesorhizobium sp. B2-3-4]TPM30035.1 hypothetical protein FJ967_27595 [Mesorhizobium sp. B2-3-4]